MTINKITHRYRAAVIDMMKVFYASDAVLSSGSDSIFENDMDACIGDSPYAEGYVFENNNDIMGYAIIAKSFSSEFGKQCIWIEDLYLKPQFRGQGIAKSFFDLLFTQYREAVFRLEVEKANKNAIAAYIKSEFEVIPYLEMINKQSKPSSKC